MEVQDHGAGKYGAGESPLPHPQSSSQYNLTWRKGQGNSQTSFIRTLIPLMKAEPSWLHHLSEVPHLLILSPWGLGFQHMNFRETQTFKPQQASNEQKFSKRLQNNSLPNPLSSYLKPETNLSLTMKRDITLTYKCQINYVLSREGKRHPLIKEMD